MFEENKVQENIHNLTGDQSLRWDCLLQANKHVDLGLLNIPIADAYFNYVKKGKVARSEIDSVNAKTHPRFLVGYDAGLLDAKLEREGARDE